MRKETKKISKALRELSMRAQNRRDFPRKGSKLAQELTKGFEKRRLDIRRFLKRKSRNNSKGIY